MTRRTRADRVIGRAARVIASPEASSGRGRAVIGRPTRGDAARPAQLPPGGRV